MHEQAFDPDPGFDDHIDIGLQEFEDMKTAEEEFQEWKVALGDRDIVEYMKNAIEEDSRIDPDNQRHLLAVTLLERADIQKTFRAIQTSTDFDRAFAMLGREAQIKLNQSTIGGRIKNIGIRIAGLFH